MKHIETLFQSFLFFLLFFCNGAYLNITVVNDCGFTVWPAISGSSDPDITGFNLTEGSSRSFEILEGNWTGRLWGRTGCSFNGSGHGSCKTGDCGSGQIECNGGSATPPVTIAQFDIYTEDGGQQGFDNIHVSHEYLSYDVSLMDGYNLPMTVESKDDEIEDCMKRGCPDDLNKRCPKELMLKGC